jgi:adenosyl cobinamide kinase/adenosyl cobinamide phosphate guanylyltransferase
VKRPMRYVPTPEEVTRENRRKEKQARSWRRNEWHGIHVLKPDYLKKVSLSAQTKTHCVIVDAVGVTE